MSRPGRVAGRVSAARVTGTSGVAVGQPRRAQPISGSDVEGLDVGAAAEHRPPVDVVVVDDHPLFSRGLELLLPPESGGRVR